MSDQVTLKVSSKKYPTPYAHMHTYTRGKLHACFHGHNAQEKSRMVFGLTILWFSDYEVRAFGNPVEANPKTEFYHDEENC
jgi:hypothetical protein